MPARIFDPNSPASVAPYHDAEEIDPDDVEPVAFRAIWVGGAGDVAVEMESGATVTFETVAAGTLLPVIVTKVLDTGTDATLLIGLR